METDSMQFFRLCSVYDAMRKNPTEMWAAARWDGALFLAVGSDRVQQSVMTAQIEAWSQREHRRLSDVK